MNGQTDSASAELGPNNGNDIFVTDIPINGYMS